MFLLPWLVFYYFVMLSIVHGYKNGRVNAGPIQKSHPADAVFLYDLEKTGQPVNGGGQIGFHGQNLIQFACLCLLSVTS